MSRSTNSLVREFEVGFLRRLRNGPYRRDELEAIVDDFMDAKRVPDEYFTDFLKMAITLQDEEFGDYGRDLDISRRGQRDSRGLSTGPSYPSRRNTGSRRSNRGSGVESPIHSSPYRRNISEDDYPHREERGDVPERESNCGVKRASAPRAEYDYVARDVPGILPMATTITVEDVGGVFNLTSPLSYVFVKGKTRSIDEVELNAMKMAVGSGGGRMGTITSPDMRFIQFWNKAVTTGKMNDFETLFSLIEKTDLPTVNAVRPFVTEYKKIMEEAIEKKEIAEYNFMVLINFDGFEPIVKEIEANINYIADTPIPVDSALYKALASPGIITHFVVNGELYRVDKKDKSFIVKHVFSKNIF